MVSKIKSLVPAFFARFWGVSEKNCVDTVISSFSAGFKFWWLLWCLFGSNETLNSEYFLGCKGGEVRNGETKIGAVVFLPPMTILISFLGF